MNKRTLYIFLTSWLAFFSGLAAFSQDTDGNPWSVQKAGELPHERIFLFTDRSIYSVAEDILYKVVYECERPPSQKPWSTVVYIELTDQNDHSFVRQKVLLDQVTGSIPIPEELKTGIYYLKAYTRWMRNFSAGWYECQPVKIINPYSDKSEPAISAGNPRSTDELTPYLRDTSIQCSTDRSTYNTREKVTLTLSAPEDGQYSDAVAITVTRKGNCATGYAESVRGLETGSYQYTGQFFPEPRGISVSGTVVEKETGKAVPDATVMMALLNKEACFSGYKTGSNGRFIFTFPDFRGSYDLFAEAVKEDQPLTIKIDPEFCQNPFNPRLIPFTLSEDEKKIAEEISVNMQINRLSDFSTPYPENPDIPKTDKVTGFYGDPSRTIYTDKYINLPDLREFLFELVPEFRIENQKKTTVLKLTRMTSLAAYSPLCLIDNVPVSHLDDFLKIPTEKIEKIEIIDKPWIAGNTQYNGIIQAFSKKRDMAGINIPRNSVFFRYKFLADEYPVRFPEFENSNRVSRIPDRRNTLYWNGVVHINPGKQQSFTFFTADLKGEYEVVVMGLSPDKKSKTITGSTRFFVD